MIDKNLFINDVYDKYPEDLLKDRITLEGNVVSCYMADMLLLDKNLTPKEDWITKDGKFFYMMLNFLRGKGYYSLDEVTILSVFGENESFMNEYENRGGWQTIERQIKIVNKDNFDAYVDAMAHSNVILRLIDDNFDPYKEIKLDSGKLVKPIDIFNELSPEEITDWVASRVNTYNHNLSSKIIERGGINFGQKFIEECSEGENAGTPFATCLKDVFGRDIIKFPFISRQMDGFLDGTFNILGAYSSVGKSALWVNIIMCLIANGRKVLVISNEEKKHAYEMRILAWITYTYNKYFKLTKKTIKQGDFTEEDLAQIDMANKWWHDNFEDNFNFVFISDMDVSMVKQITRDYVLRYGYDTVLIDTMKIDFTAINGNGTRIDLNLLRDSREFDKLAKQLNIIMLASLQLAINTQGQLFLTANTFSQSKQIKEVAESIMLMRNVYPEELDKDNKKYYCKPFRLVNVDGKWIEQEYEIDQNSVYRMLFVDKTRSGSNSFDTGVAYLLKYRGDYASFSESAQCRPKHAIIV